MAPLYAQLLRTKTKVIVDSLLLPSLTSASPMGSTSNIYPLPKHIPPPPGSLHCSRYLSTETPQEPPNCSDSRLFPNGPSPIAFRKQPEWPLRKHKSDHVTHLLKTSSSFHWGEDKIQTLCCGQRRSKWAGPAPSPTSSLLWAFWVLMRRWAEEPASHSIYDFFLLKLCFYSEKNDINK